jgi:Arc/MetJ family transcription regulator
MVNGRLSDPAKSQVQPAFAARFGSRFASTDQRAVEANPKLASDQEKKVSDASLTSCALKTASNDATLKSRRLEMRTTVTLDDDLVADAQEMTGITEKSALLREALKRLVQQEAAHRLALLGGSEPDFRAPARWRPDEP